MLPEAPTHLWNRYCVRFSFLKPDFNLGEIDLISDRNKIRKLLRFVNDTAGDKFQIGVNITGKTALFTCIQRKSTEVLVGFNGFGHNFEKAYTKGAAGSTGHHRIVSYDFGGLKCLIRQDTDGYLGEEETQLPTRNQRH
jgi:hypothetical protein